MKRFCTTCTAAAFVMIGVVTIGLSASPLQAAPPTVTPSPGYDARLQEQRSAPTVSTSPYSAPAGPILRPVHRRHHVRHGNYY